MRAVRALEKMPGAEMCAKFDEFVRSLKAGNLADKYATISGEDESKSNDEVV